MKIGVGINIWGCGRRIPPELAEELRETPRHSIEWLAELVALAAIVANIVVLALQYAALPDIVPTHFGAGGQPNGYGGKGTLLFLLAVDIGMYVMMTVLPIFPRSFNFAVKITPENASQQYLLVRYMVLGMKALISWLFLYISYQAMAVALGRSMGMGAAIWIFFVLMMLGLGLVFWLSYKWR